MITVRISSGRQGEGKTTLAFWLKKFIEEDKILDFPPGKKVEYCDEAAGKRPAKQDTQIYIIDEPSL